MYGETKCPICGKILKGFTAMCDIDGQWECSECAQDGMLHCEAGTKIIFKHPITGSSWDRQKTKEYLKMNETYTVKHLDLYGHHTDIELEEVPGIKFNAVNFERS